MPAERPEPTLKEILEKVRAIVREGQEGDERPAPRAKPLFGFSPGLLLLAVVALAITIAAAVKNMK